MKDPTGRYERSNKLLGRGAFKEVYKAFDTECGIEVAWNQLALGSLSQRSAEKILEEIQILQTLTHENIITFSYSWCTPDPEDSANFQVIFITELMTSGTLKSYIKKCTPPPIKVKVIKNWAKQILEGLNYMHTCTPPIIHRDLKCDNVFINGNNGLAKIGDFGLATTKRKDRECISTTMGTPEFMAPELYDEQYDEKVDIYAFGMCILELVTLDYPYSECENAAQIYRKVTNGVKPASLGTIENEQVREFIELCIQTDYKTRPSASDLLKHPFLKENSPVDLGLSLPEKSSSVTNTSAQVGLINQCVDLDLLNHQVQFNSPNQPTTTTQSAQPSAHSRVESPIPSAHSPIEIKVSVLSCQFPVVQLEMFLGQKQIKFPFNLQSESPLEVASEMVRHELVPAKYASIVCDAIKSAIQRVKIPFTIDLFSRTVGSSPLSSTSPTGAGGFSILDADFSSHSWEALNLNTAPPMRINGILPSIESTPLASSASIEFLQQLELEMFTASTANSSPQIAPASVSAQSCGSSSSSAGSNHSSDSLIDFFEESFSGTTGAQAVSSFYSNANANEVRSILDVDDMEEEEAEVEGMPKERPSEESSVSLVDV
jgi:serine/threonine protein kinase